ncbi:P2Y purinoceptor 14 isoform X2 [Kryptolebias marmoratus]|nr:P2Y purinoceptor 14 isoform X2 [Kryptolebias marmoratus]
MSDLKAGTSAFSSFSVSAQNTSSPPGCGPVDKSGRLFFVLVYSLLVLVSFLSSGSAGSELQLHAVSFLLLPLQVGLVVNSFILWFHCCRVRRRVASSLMIYLRNLSAADLLLCFSLPLRIINYTSSSDTLLYCSFGASALFLNMYASILFMGYISANRYLKIVCLVGTHFLMTTRAAHIISTATWVFLLAPMTTYIVLMQINHKHLNSPVSSCEDLLTETFKPFFTVVHVCAGIIFLSVLVSLLFFYHSTSRRVLEAQKNQPTSCDSGKLVKSRRNILVLVSVFCVCFVPYHLVRLLSLSVLRDCVLDRLFYYSLEFTCMVSVLNVCLDPLVYFALSKAFRTRVSLRLRTARVSSRGREEQGEPSPANIQNQVSLSTTG